MKKNMVQSGIVPNGAHLQHNSYQKDLFRRLLRLFWWQRKIDDPVDDS